MNQQPRSQNIHDDDSNEQVVHLNPQSTSSESNGQIDIIDCDQKSPMNISGGILSDCDDDISNDSGRIDYADHQNIVKGNLSQSIDTIINTLVNKNAEVASIIDKTRAKLSHEEYDKWLSLTYMLASVHPYKNETRISPIYPGTNTVIRAIRMMLGPRGMVHGWAGILPDLKSEIQIKENIHCVWPERWAPHSDSEGNSSFRSDSSGQCFNSAGENWSSGPRGVASGRLPVSGLTSVSNTSSCLSEDSLPESRLDIYPTKDYRKPEQIRLLKRLDNYLTQSKHERHQRREIRRTRRIERSRHDHQRRLTEPAYDLEVKRAVFLAADRLKRDCQIQDHMEAEEQKAESESRKEFRAARRNYLHSPRSANERPPLKTHPSPFHTLCNANCPLFRLRTAIGKQVCDTWTKLYGKYIEKAGEMAFHCWVTPIRWVKQDGPK